MPPIHQGLLPVALIIAIAMIAPLSSAREPSAPRSAYSQTQQGITVSLEKITIERILNDEAWIKARAAAETKPDTEKANAATEVFRRTLPAKVVTCFVSVTGDTKGYGPVTIDYADDQLKTSYSGHAFFSPPKWQPQLPNLAIDPAAGGIKAWHTVSARTPLSDLFPARIEVAVTKADGKRLTFVFENVGFYSEPAHQAPVGPKPEKAADQ